MLDTNYRPSEKVTANVHLKSLLTHPQPMPLVLKSFKEKCPSLSLELNPASPGDVLVHLQPLQLNNAIPVAG